MKKKTFSLFCACLSVPFYSHADQPIMNMMPRWDGGFGFQVLQEYRHESKLLDGKKEIGDGLTETVHINHIEAVYTWDRSIRLTAKLPVIIQAERELLGAEGKAITQKDSGIGDLTLALPLKRYFNEYGRSGSWTLAPQLRIPLDKADAYDVPDRAWGGGLSMGYEMETTKVFLATSLSFWIFEGEEPEEAHASLDLGWNFHTRGQLLFENDFHYDSDEEKTFSSGPALYWRFTDTIHARIEAKFDLYDDQGNGGYDHGEGFSAKIGIGFVW